MEILREQSENASERQDKLCFEIPINIDYCSHMKKTNVSQAKSKLSSLIEEVKHGESFLIFDRNRPVARLEPVVEGSLGHSERALAMVHSGVVSPPRHALDASAFLGRPKVRLPHGASAVRTVLEERRESQ
jgi:antitoxin (DNA-binding transcriptional repressor) of toxin-antitoxin stability system